MVNLAVNARDAMPRGGKFILETGAVRFDEVFAEQHQAMAAGKYVVLAVSDTGTGMDEATSVAHLRAFLHHQRDWARELAWAWPRCTALSSRAQDTSWSTVNRDTERRLRSISPARITKSASHRQPEVETVSPKRQRATILLVEDDEIMRGLTRQLLQEHGYTVVEADDGKSALEWMQSHPGPIDLLLTDVVMRRMSGPELVERLNASHPNLKVVYMSGYTGELIAEREVLKRGITLLEKPFTRTALLNTIHTTLG